MNSSLFRLLLAVGCLLLLAACGTPASQRPSAQSRHSPSTPAASATPGAASAQAGGQPTPSPGGSPTPTALTLSGPLNDSIQGAAAKAQGTCGVAAGGFNVSLEFASKGRDYELKIQVLDYRGPGSYGIPPERVSIVSMDPANPALYPVVSGSVSVAADASSGAIDGAFAGSHGSVTGHWSCV